MKELARAYDPAGVEPAVLKKWLESDVFQPHPPAAEALAKNHPRYCIVIPPPNVTGTLHMGHAFTFTLQDILIRQKRMQGHSTLWQPGTDHAGIATQMIVERMLEKEGLSRRALGREKFLERVWQWKEQSGGAIVHQLKRMGASCDWSRLRFTLDEGLSRAVREVFVRLYEEGLIYRGKRLVNWDPVLETAISDLEVVHEEEEGRLWYIRYPLADDPSRHIIVATTRPETMLGDTAVAVHPEDERYRDVIGREVILPLVGRRIPVIADEAVDPEFGTGAVKITPAHDFNDYEIGKRHGLPMINIFTTRAHIVDADFIPPSYRGLDRYEARERIVADLDAEGLLEKEEPHLHKVGRGDRSHAVIEPFLTDQWFVRTKPLAEEAIRAVKEGRIRFVPAFWEKTYFQWMENIEDWCISRQLWWGHRIPAWFCADCGEVTVAREDPDVCAHCGSANIRQDEDVLDTWFSSALWPFSTLGWPEDTPEMRAFYPTDVLVTGFDIIFFWVARMIMMGLKFTGKEPFRTVYIHALIRDKFGQKMSKSKGNVIDPLEMIDKYGADALRFTLARMAAPGRDVKLDERRIEAARHFMNKIWNAARFAFMNLGDARPTPELEPEHDLNRWALAELAAAIREVEEALAEYRFHDAAAALQRYIWNSFCDWYLEAAKVALAEGGALAEETRTTLATVMDAWLRLLHPFCPFITEALFARLHGEEAMLAAASWPKAPQADEAAQARMQRIFAIVEAVRSVRGEMNIPPARKIAVKIAAGAEIAREVQAHAAFVKALARVEEITFVEEGAEVRGAAAAPLAHCTVFVPLAGVVDVAAELARVEKQLQKLAREAEKLEKKLKNENFLQRAPAEVVEKAREELKDVQKRMETLAQARKRLEEAA